MDYYDYYDDMVDAYYGGDYHVMYGGDFYHHLDDDYEEDGDDDDDIEMLSGAESDESSLPRGILKTPPTKKTPKDKVYSMQLERYEIFKAQDQENGHFDCALEIDGKKLYVHKYFLAAASEYFRANLLRWSKDGVIKIEDPYYTYATVYQLICFIYSCECEITKENVFVLTDMAEFYGVELLKESCIEFLTEMNIAVEDVEKMVEVAQRYSLNKFLLSLKGTVKRYMKDLIISEQFLKYKKPFVEFLSSVEKDSRLEEEAFFDAVYKWAQNKAAMKAEESADEEFNVEGFIKEEMNGILLAPGRPEGSSGAIWFFRMNLKFVKESILKKRFLFTPKKLYKIIEKAGRNSGQEDESFETLYQFAKDVVTKDRDPFVAEDIIVVDAVKKELSEILPKIKFHRMSVTFLRNFVVERGFCFSFIRLYDYLLVNRGWKRETTFKSVYLLAESKVLKKHLLSPDLKFKICDAVKKELADVIPKVKFSKMSVDFWMDFGISKEFYMSPSDFRNFFECSRYSYRSKEELFKVIFNLAEKQVVQKQVAAKEKYESIKKELSQVLPLFQFHQMKLEFLMESVVGKGFLLSPTIVRDFFLKCQKDYGNEEEAFKAVYKLAEKQAIEDQNGNADDTFNLKISVKDELVETIPVVQFGKMSKKFLSGFVVAKGIISDEQFRYVHYACVEVKSDNVYIKGVFDDKYGIMKLIPENGYSNFPHQWNKLRFSKLKFKIPTFPSTVQKMKGAEWFLCFEKDGVLSVKYHGLIERSDYLIAEMKTTSDFMFNTDESATLSAIFNNV